MRRVFKAIAVIVLTVLVIALLVPVVVPPFLDRTYYRGPQSDHFDGQHFFNPDDPPATQEGAGFSFGRMAGFLLRRDRAAWPADVPVEQTAPAPRVPGPPAAARKGYRREQAHAATMMRATWIGHATVLVQTQGLNILTDPVWSDVVSPFPSLLGPRRVRAPGVAFADLPKIDVVLVSHNHYDHMDLPTLSMLWQSDRPLIVTSLGNDTILGWHGIKAVARDWGGRVQVKPGVDVIVERVHHWGSRWGKDRNRALWSGFTVTLPGGNLFFAGDTGPGDMKWPTEARRHGPVRLALLPIGAIRPAAMMSGNHIGPKEAVDAFVQLGATRAMAIHWGTFQLSDEAIDFPPRLLKEELRARGLPEKGRFVVMKTGAPWDIPEMAK